MAAERLSGLDTAFLCLERDVTPMHLGALAIFRPDQPVRSERVVSLLADRARRLPQLRRRVRSGWFPPGVASWADDPGFRAEDHVYLHQLAGNRNDSGADGHLSAAELVAELMARPLRRDRPLWEFHVMVGMAGDRFAVLVKLHHALGDGLAALEIGVGLLEVAGPGVPIAGRDAPGSGQLPARTCSARVVAMTCSVLLRPLRLVRGAPRAARDTVGQAAEVVAMAASLLRSARLPSAGSPLVTLSSGRRGLGLARLDLAQVRRIRAHFGGTVNDVLLAVVAGALREWLVARGHPVDGLRLRALIPVSRRTRAGSRAGANEMSGYLCELPVAEPDPGRRLRAVQEAMRHSKATGTTRGPGAIPLLADRLPPAVHRVVAPVAGQVAALLFDLLVTSVPLPGVPLRLDGAELAEVFPVAPLAPGHALGVALSCYRGAAYIGLHVDREALPDVQGLAEAVSASAAGLDRMRA
jgi:diacylglycerol O-acyltransferase / wax synthase